MIDLHKLALRLGKSSQRITPEQFNEWKNSHITHRLFSDCIETILTDIDSRLPDTVEEGIPAAYRKEGGKQVLEDLLNWEPDYDEEEDD